MGLTGKKAAIAAAPFCSKQKKVVAKVQLFASNFPGAKDYKDLPSGKGLRDMKIAFIVKVWKADRLAQKKGEEVSKITFYKLLDMEFSYLILINFLLFLFINRLKNTQRIVVFVMILPSMISLPINWWLDNECICYLLAMLVCCDLPDISNEPESVPTGPTRNAQRKQPAEEDAKDKAIKNTTKTWMSQPRWI